MKIRDRNRKHCPGLATNQLESASSLGTAFSAKPQQGMSPWKMGLWWERDFCQLEVTLENKSFGKGMDEVKG